MSFARSLAALHEPVNIALFNRHLRRQRFPALEKDKRSDRVGPTYGYGQDDRANHEFVSTPKGNS